MSSDERAASLTTVVVVTYEHRDEIDQCLSALAASTVRPRTIVVDNASSDGTATHVRAAHPWVEVVALDRNVGYADAHNEVMSRIATPVVTLVNPDCLVEPDTIEVLERILLGDPSLGAVSALLTNLDGTPQEFARRDLDLRIVAGDLTWLGRSLDGRFFSGRTGARRRYRQEVSAFLSRGGSEALMDVDCPAAACVALRKAALPDPIFPSELPLMFNDGALYRTMRATGFRVAIAASASARHGHGTSIRRLRRDRYRAEFVQAALVYTRHHWTRRRRAAAIALFLMDGIAQVATGVARRDRALVSEARGTLGGLGIPGGARPWLGDVDPPGKRARQLLGSVRRLPLDVVVGWRDRWWRARFGVACRMAGARSRVRVRLDVHPTATIEPGVRFDLRGPAIRLTIGPNVRVRSGVILRVWGGQIELEPGCEVRHDSCLTVKGRLVVGRRTVIGRASGIHADGDLRIGAGVLVAEMATVIDTDHTFGHHEVGGLHTPVEARPVRLEDGCFIGARAQISPGVTIGRGAVVGAHAVVVEDVPAGSLAVGIPARVVGPVRESTPDDGAT